jgi:hypothetical protein
VVAIEELKFTANMKSGMNAELVHLIEVPKVATIIWVVSHYSREIFCASYVCLDRVEAMLYDRQG